MSLISDANEFRRAAFKSLLIFDSVPPTQWRQIRASEVSAKCGRTPDFPNLPYKFFKASPSVAASRSRTLRARADQNHLEVVNPLVVAGDRPGWGADLQRCPVPCNIMQADSAPLRVEARSPTRRRDGA